MTAESESPTANRLALVLLRKDLIHALSTLGVVRRRRFARIVPVWLRYNSNKRLLAISEDRHPATATIQAKGSWPPAGATISLFTLRSAAEASDVETIELIIATDAVRIDTPNGHVLLNLMPFGPESRRAGSPQK